MTLEAAYAKIMFLLSQGVTGADFGKWMRVSIAGEISPSSL
jgi:L-asparaginase